MNDEQIKKWLAKYEDDQQETSKYISESGWPSDIHWRQAQIMNLLSGVGLPMTRVDIERALGLGYNSLGTFIKDLIGRGLVVRLDGFFKGTQRSKKGSSQANSRPGYTLGIAALAILEERLQCLENIET